MIRRFNLPGGDGGQRREVDLGNEEEPEEKEEEEEDVDDGEVLRGSFVSGKWSNCKKKTLPLNRGF